MKMLTRRAAPYIPLLLASLLWGLQQGWAQTSTTGAITGSVADASGAVIPTASVAIVNTGTGLTRSVTTSTDGLYAFPLLPVGTYVLTATKEGFQTLKQSGIVLNVGQTLQINFTLQVGQTTQTVEVRATVQLLAPES